MSRFLLRLSLWHFEISAPCCPLPRSLTLPLSLHPCGVGKLLWPRVDWCGTRRKLRWLLLVTILSPSSSGACMPPYCLIMSESEGGACSNACIEWDCAHWGKLESRSRSSRRLDIIWNKQLLKQHYSIVILSYYDYGVWIHRAPSTCITTVGHRLICHTTIHTTTTLLKCTNFHHFNNGRMAVSPHTRELQTKWGTKSSARQWSFRRYVIRPSNSTMVTIRNQIWKGVRKYYKKKLILSWSTLRNPRLMYWVRRIIQ